MPPQALPRSREGATRARHGSKVSIEPSFDSRRSHVLLHGELHAAWKCNHRVHGACEAAALALRVVLCRFEVDGPSTRRAGAWTERFRARRRACVPGDGRVRRSKRISLRVPPGVDSGSRLRVRSEGNAGKKVRSRARVAARSRPLVFFDEWRALPITRSNDRLTRVSPRPINRHPSHRRAAPRATSTSSSP